jgi:hypothetical protein
MAWLGFSDIETIACAMPSAKCLAYVPAIVLER